MATEHFCLRWNNHQSTLVSVFDNLLESGTLVDCTLAADGRYLKAHKVVLSACSPYLSMLLSQHYDKHPILILKDVKFDELKAMLDYMYRGEVNISQEQLSTFLKAAESLQIKGLTDTGGEEGNGLQTNRPPSSNSTTSIPNDEPQSPGPPGEGRSSPIPKKRKRNRHSDEPPESEGQTKLAVSEGSDRLSREGGSLSGTPTNTGSPSAMKNVNFGSGVKREPADVDGDGQMSVDESSDSTMLSKPGPSNGGSSNSKGKMPTPSRKLWNYTKEDLSKAVVAVRNKRMCLSDAAKTFKIPTTTLSDRLKGSIKDDVPIGRPSFLTAEGECAIVDWVDSIAQAGFPVKKSQIDASISKVIKDKKKLDPFTAVTVPGRSWYKLFLGRHPTVETQISRTQKAYKGKLTEVRLREWFTEIKAYLEKKHLIEVFRDPRRIFNADESAFFLRPGKTVIAKKKEKKITSLNRKDNAFLSVFITANAAGEAAPPIVVYPHRKIPLEIINTFPDTWGIGKSNSGWMMTESFFEYLENVFIPWLNENEIPKPIIFFLDYYSEHITKHLSDLCVANEIELISLYPSATNLLLPMDVAFFHLVEPQWKVTLDEWYKQNEGRQMKEEEFAPLLKGVLDNTLEEEAIKHVFELTGLVDLDPDKIDFKQLMKNSYNNIIDLD